LLTNTEYPSALVSANIDRPGEGSDLYILVLTNSLVPQQFKPNTGGTGNDPEPVSFNCRPSDFRGGKIGSRLNIIVHPCSAINKSTL
jgi:hypothetical protein